MLMSTQRTGKIADSREGSLEKNVGWWEEKTVAKRSSRKFTSFEPDITRDKGGRSFARSQETVASYFQSVHVPKPVWCSRESTDDGYSHNGRRYSVQRPEKSRGR
jgi:hypothetical protein